MYHGLIVEETTGKCRYKGPERSIWDLGIPGKKLGPWDLTPFENGILEVRCAGCELGIFENNQI